MSLVKTEKVKDHRAGYQRQADEPVIYTCSVCNAKVHKVKNEFIHVGTCKD